MGWNSHNYTWDPEGHMTSSTLNGTTVNYSYTAAGQLMDTTCSDCGVSYTEPVYDLAGHVVATWFIYANGSEWEEPTVWLGGRPLASYDWTNSMMFQHENALGSGTIKTTANSFGAYYEEGRDYSPWGQGMFWSNNGDHADADYDDLFAGMELDDTWSSGTWVTPNRRYSPSLGRWLSPDPLGGDITNPQSLNRYTYALNNPTSLTDPSGLWVWSTGGCSYDTAAFYVMGEFQGYDTELMGCGALPTIGCANMDGYGCGYNGPNYAYTSGVSTSGGGGSGSASSAPPAINCSSPPPFPPTPPGASVDANMQEAQQIQNNLVHPDPLLVGTDQAAPDATGGVTWFVGMVLPGGPWDYKAANGLYTAFGNFNFGATCNAMGFSLQGCQRGAGVAAYGTAAKNVLQGGNWTAGPGNPLGSPAQDGGMPVYGDQATGTENQTVIAGFGYAQWKAACHK